MLPWYTLALAALPSAVFAHPEHPDIDPVPLIVTDAPTASLTAQQWDDLKRVKHFHTWIQDPTETFTSVQLPAHSAEKRYHLGDDTNHCWINSTLTDPCPQNFDVQWVIAPPDLIYSGATIQTSYALSLGGVAIVGNVLIAHANLHACPTEMGFCSVTVKNGTQSASGAIVTQEAAQVSNSTVIYSNLVLAEGSWCIVSHVRVFYSANGYKTQLDVARARYRKVLRATCKPGQMRLNPISQPDAVCAACSIGTFSNTTNAPTCTPCPPGTYQSELGMTSCIRCPAGYIQKSIGQSQCIACPGFTFDDGTGVNCQLCPHGAYTTGAAKSKNECICQAGYVNVTNTCVPCPANGVCCECDHDMKHSWEIIEYNFHHNLDPCTTCLNGSNTAIPLPGFYISDEDSNSFYQCEPHEACLGGPPSLGVCEEGYVGARCGLCDENYYADTSLVCQKCGPIWAPVLMFIAFLICLSLVLVLTLVMTIMEEGTDAGAALLVYFQILDLTRRTRTIWPKTTAKILFVSALFNLDLTYFRLDCITRVPYGIQQGLWLISPFFVLLVLLTVSFGISLLRQKYKHLRADPPIQWNQANPYPFSWAHPFRKLFEVPDVEYWRIVQSWLIFCSFPMYPMLVSRTLIYFNCGIVMNSNGFTAQFLKEIPHIKCGSSEFAHLLTPSVVGLLCWCVIPPLINVMFLQRANVTGDIKTSAFYHKYWPLYKPYRQDNLVWLSINLLFLMLFHSTTVVFKETDDQMTAGSIVLLIEMAAVAWRRPWTEEFVAYLDLIQHGSILIFLMISRKLTNENIEDFDVVLTSIILVTVAALLFLMGWMFVHHLNPTKVHLPKSLRRFERVLTDDPENSGKSRPSMVLKLESLRHSLIK
ncbi:hypothetical protein BDR26DRAFT_921417 [Obelidium mucronatum]|nr:hypothetical protein BDR26DRAFT_921417 [Obelidium mucronatum]